MKTMLRFGFLAAFLGLFIMASDAQATTHVIPFGHTAYMYWPDTLGVSVGDTIQWVGDFTFHPLQSMHVPAGADSFYYDGTDTIFRYAVKAAGEYDYHCVAHDASQHMHGMFFTIPASSQKKWVITFGDAHVYDPDDLPNVALGDTIEWQGDFTKHPLTADLFPIGAKTLDTVMTGTSFDYVVRAAGEYTYYCIFHGGVGGFHMAGKFAAHVASVKSEHPALFSLGEIVPNPIASKATINFSLKTSSVVSMTIHSVDGKEIATLTHSFYPQGDHSVMYNASSLSAGEYLVVLESDGISQAKKLIVTK